MNFFSEYPNLHKPSLRVLAILHLIDSHSEGLTLSQISEELGLPKGTISPILKTLVETGYANLSGGRYVIGVRAFELGLSYGEHSDLLEIIHNKMKDLVEEVEETSQFAILNGTDVLYLLRINSKNPISIISEVGKRLPAHATAIGKAILSLKDDAWLEKTYKDYKFQKIGPQTLTSFAALMKEIQSVRATGLAYESEESNLGVACMAVPIVVSGGQDGGLSVSVPKYRLSPKKRSQIEEELTKTRAFIEEIARFKGRDTHFNHK